MMLHGVILVILIQILRADDHYGFFNPARTPTSDFQTWTYNNDLIHLPTMGTTFPWYNGRSGRRQTKWRLNRVVCK